MATVLSITIVVFFLVRTVQGDVVDVLSINGDFTYSQQAALRTDPGLDRSLATQFGRWCDMAAHLAVLLGVGVAVLAALFPGSPFVVRVELINIWSIALPTFSVGIAAVIVFALWLGWMPAVGTIVPAAIILAIDAAGTLVKMLHEDSHGAIGDDGNPARRPGRRRWPLRLRALRPQQASGGMAPRKRKPIPTVVGLTALRRVMAAVRR